MDQAPFSLGLVSHVQLAARSEPSFIEYFNIPSNARSPYYVYIHIPSYTYVCLYIYIIYTYIPVVPHRAVAEVSKIGNL